MDLIKMWSDGGILMSLLLAPTMLGVLSLGVWQVIVARGGVAPKLSSGTMVTLLAAGLLNTGVGLRLVLGILASIGAKPDVMVRGFRVALQPLLFVFAGVLMLCILQLIVVLRTAGASGRLRRATTGLRVVASLALTSVVLSTSLEAAWVTLTSTLAGPESPSNPGHFFAMLQRLNALGLATAVLALVLGLATIALSVASRRDVARASESHHTAADV